MEAQEIATKQAKKRFGSFHGEFTSNLTQDLDSVTLSLRGELRLVRYETLSQESNTTSTQTYSVCRKSYVFVSFNQKLYE